MGAVLCLEEGGFLALLPPEAFRGVVFVFLVIVEETGRRVARVVRRLPGPRKVESSAPSDWDPISSGESEGMSNSESFFLRSAFRRLAGIS